MSNRHLARTLALQTLFEWDFKGKEQGVLDDIIKYNFQSFAPEYNDHTFTERIVKGVVSNIEEIDSYIKKYAPQWPIEQITNVDRNILRVGVYELIFDLDVPSKVAINEAIEIAKAFGGESSGNFVNGVLGSIYSQTGPSIKSEDKEEGEKEEKETPNSPPEADPQAGKLQTPNTQGAKETPNFNVQTPTITDSQG